MNDIFARARRPFPKSRCSIPVLKLPWICFYYYKSFGFSAQLFKRGIYPFRVQGMNNIEAIINEISSLPNAYVEYADPELRAYVERELPKQCPVVKSDAEYFEYLKRYQQLTIGLGGSNPLDDEIENDSFSIDPVEELFNRYDWMSTGNFDIASGAYASRDECVYCGPICYAFGFWINKKGIYKRILFADGRSLPPSLFCKTFSQLLNEILENKGIFLRIDKEGRPF